MIEFTGERVIPGEVNDDLWAEHLARYAYAADLFASDAPGQKRTLDIGCGTGYGVAEFAGHSKMSVGIDLAPEAIGYARTHFSANAAFIAASATDLPFADRSFDLITAFEVIEHLADWNGLLGEAARVLRDDGVFFLSTPNKLYYGESRVKDGPNPYHVHEFEFVEFRDALARHFPRVTILLQNRVEAMAFSPALPGTQDRPALSRIDGNPALPEEAGFFLAVCSRDAGPGTNRFLYVPRASNLLRERERHIRLLEGELSQSQTWLREVTDERQALIELHAEQTRHLEEHNLWAQRLEKDWRAAMQRISQLQDEFAAEQAAGVEVAAAYEIKVRGLEDENRRRAEWALDVEKRLSERLAAQSAELAEAVRSLDTAEGTVVERTLWAQELQRRVEGIEAQLRMIRESRWLRLGRAMGLGPQVQD